MAEKKKVTRSGSETRKRQSTIQIRVTTAERQQIEDDASRSNLTIGSYARNVLLNAPIPKQGHRPPVEKKELAKLLGQIGKVGSNLNQLARTANSYLPIESNELLKEIEALKQLRVEIKSALGKRKKTSSIADKTPSRIHQKNQHTKTLTSPSISASELMD